MINNTFEEVDSEEGVEGNNEAKTVYAYLPIEDAGGCMSVSVYYGNPMMRFGRTNTMMRFEYQAPSDDTWIDDVSNIFFIYDWKSKFEHLFCFPK